MNWLPLLLPAVVTAAVSWVASVTIPTKKGGVQSQAIPVVIVAPDLPAAIVPGEAVKLSPQSLLVRSIPWHSEAAPAEK